MMDHYALMEEVFFHPEKIEEYADHSDWRVRYATAVAIGETKDVKWSSTLLRILERESKRDLYSQPATVRFEHGPGDTKMAERLLPTRAIFDKEYPEELKEDWRCRGRVKQACLFAVRDMGIASPEMIAYLRHILDEPGEDYGVCAAAAMALGRVGNLECLPSLKKALEIDEWCVQTEAKKAIRSLEGEQV